MCAADLEVLRQPGIAVVGTRHPTPYGSGMAERLACDLAAQDWSLLVAWPAASTPPATAAPSTAKGKTVAVFGTGVDVIYPKENSRLSEQILAFGGALISEFPLGNVCRAAEFSHPQSHHQRNVGRACWWWKPPNIRHAHHGALRARSRIATFLPCPATSPTRIPGDRTHSSNRAPSWLRPGRTFGKNSRQKYDLR